MLIETVLQAFSLPRLEETVTIYNHLLRHGQGMDDLVCYLDERKRKIKDEQEKDKRLSEEIRKKWEANAPLCPSCGGPVNPPKHICKKQGPENVKGWTCLWYCVSGDCTFEKYTYEDAAEELKKIMERRQDNAETNTSQLAV